VTFGDCNTPVLPVEADDTRVYHPGPGTPDEGDVIRRHITALRLSLIAVDAMSAVGVFAVVSLLRFGSGWPDVWTRTGLDAASAMALWATVWVLTLWIRGLYRLRARWSARTDIFDLLHAAILVAVVIFSGLFVLKLPAVSRLFLVELLATQLAFDAALRLALRLGFTIARTRGRNTRFLLIVGTTPLAERFANLVEQHVELGFIVRGHLDGPTATGFVPTRPILGSLADAEAVLHSHVIDEVAICLPRDDDAWVEPIAGLCQSEGRMVRIPLEEPGLSLEGARSETFEGMTILSLVYGPDRVLALIAKRIVDVAGSLVALGLLTPVLAVVAAGILVTDGRPILFRQRRMGLHGRTFDVYKFRTMVPDAEARLAALLEHNEVTGHAFKLRFDPRISRIGRWLRRTSLDELPQLLNVLRGEMSLVGPRPPLPREVDAYDVWQRRRLSMKPGITGLWQVSARNETEFNRWVEIDLDYIDRWSLWLDLKIMARTVPAMLTGR